MTPTALALLAGTLGQLSKGQREMYYAQLHAWTKKLGVVLPDEVKLHLATRVLERRPPDPRAIRQMMDGFGPRPAA